MGKLRSLNIKRNENGEEIKNTDEGNEGETDGAKFKYTLVLELEESDRDAIENGRKLPVQLKIANRGTDEDDFADDPITVTYNYVDENYRTQVAGLRVDKDLNFNIPANSIEQIDGKYVAVIDIQVNVNGDEKLEEDEHFILRVFRLDGQKLSPKDVKALSAGPATIRNDDTIEKADKVSKKQSFMIGGDDDEFFFIDDGPGFGTVRDRGETVALLQETGSFGLGSVDLQDFQLG